MAAVFKSAWPYAKDALNLPVKSVDEALPFYLTVMGFPLISRAEGPRSAILGRDDIKIGLCENGGDPTQEGCFFEVDDVEEAFAELKARGLNEGCSRFPDRPSWRNELESVLRYCAGRPLLLPGTTAIKCGTSR